MLAGIGERNLRFEKRKSTDWGVCCQKKLAVCYRKKLAINWIIYLRKLDFMSWNLVFISDFILWFWGNKNSVGYSRLTFLQQSRKMTKQILDSPYEKENIRESKRAYTQSGIKERGEKLNWNFWNLWLIKKIQLAPCTKYCTVKRKQQKFRTVVGCFGKF